LRIDSHHSFSERYPLDHLGSILKRNRFDGSVLVVREAAGDADFVKGVVFETDRMDPAVLDAFGAHRKFRGICYRFSDAIPEGLDELERRGIPLDALAVLPLLPRIADRFPALRIVIGHLGSPGGEEWLRQMEQAAGIPQVYCKLSGLTRFTPSPRDYVRHALDLFGPRRLMFGSDWPNSLPEHTWKENLAIFTQSIGAQTIETREELLGGTATRFYGL
jgi:L-fuconolactonase